MRIFNPVQYVCMYILVTLFSSVCNWIFRPSVSVSWFKKLHFFWLPSPLRLFHNSKALALFLCCYLPSPDPQRRAMVHWKTFFVHTPVARCKIVVLIVFIFNLSLGDFLNLLFDESCYFYVFQTLSIRYSARFLYKTGQNCSANYKPCIIHIGLIILNWCFFEANSVFILISGNNDSKLQIFVSMVFIIEEIQKTPSERAFAELYGRRLR